ncbi:hypothetical protein AHAS_Ahas15G0323200 [Arachis hypogaea]
MEINQHQNKHTAINGLFLPVSSIFNPLPQEAQDMICLIPLSDVVHMKARRLMDRGGHAYRRWQQETLLDEDKKSPLKFLSVLLPH